MLVDAPGDVRLVRDATWPRSEIIECEGEQFGEDEEASGKTIAQPQGGLPYRVGIEAKHSLAPFIIREA